MAQLFLLSLTGFAMVVVILRYRHRRISTVGFLLWLLLWVAAALTVLFPGSTIVLAHLLGIGRGADLVMYLGLILIFYLLFKVYVRLEQMNLEMTEIVRAVALREAGLGGSKGKSESPSRSLDPRP